MSNDYFNFTNRLVEHTTARCTALNEIFDQIETGLTKLPDVDLIKKGKICFAQDTGAVNAHVVALPLAPSGYVTGQEVQFQAAHTNTGASTINVNGLGVKPIRRLDGSDLTAGDIVANTIISLRYNASSGWFQIMNGLPGDVVAAAASAAESAASADASATSASQAQTAATNAANSAAQAAGYAAGLHLPPITTGDFGKSLFVNAAETGYELVQPDPGAGKNFVINGGFDIWQRGTSWSSGNNHVLTADRHWFYTTHDVTATASRQEFTLGQTAVPGEPQYYLHIVSNNNVGGCGWYYKIENVQTLVGKSVTVSVYVRGPATSTSNPFSLIMYQDFGSGGSASVLVGATELTLTLPSDWVRVVLTATLPSLSGKTIGSGSSLKINFWGWSWTGNLDIANVQLEIGSSATSFLKKSVAAEQSECERYFSKLAQEGGGAFAVGQVVSTNTFRGVIHYRTKMRVAPSVTFSSLSDLNVDGVSCNGSANIQATTSRISLDLNCPGSPFTTGHCVLAGFTNSNGFITFDAEL
ncbi:MAG: hypothetical protein H7833_05750 [Magnetococcus sp. DMHC-1]|nr:hypothetical protein [Magnetococcales bacterium]